MGDYGFLANVFILGKVEAVTGISIGGSREGYEIGGMDNPVIRYIEGKDEYPYLPGSSIKGKLRSLMEWADPNKLTNSGEPHTCKEEDCYICRCFGRPAEKGVNEGPGRLIIRDSYPDRETKELMRWIEVEKGQPKTEWKTEVALNRLTSHSTTGPREVERIPKGSKFDLRMVYGIYETDGDKGETDVENLDFIVKGLRMLEDSSLGGSGSRGYGRIKLSIMKEPPIRTVKDYESSLHKIKPENLVGMEEIKVDDIKQRIIDRLSNVRI